MRSRFFIMVMKCSLQRFPESHLRLDTPCFNSCHNRSSDSDDKKATATESLIEHLIKAGAIVEIPLNDYSETPVNDGGRVHLEAQASPNYLCEPIIDVGPLAGTHNLTF